MFILEWKVGLTANQLTNTPHKKNKGQKPYDHLHRQKKDFGKI